MGNAIPFENAPKYKAIKKYLRNNSTFPEILLWQKLRMKQMLGYKFRRQFQIEKYIVDFYCHELKLIVEIDGSVHFEKSKEDKERQKYLEKKGYCVIRYINEQVLQNIYFVLDNIAEACKLRKEILQTKNPS